MTINNSQKSLNIESIIELVEELRTDVAHELFDDLSSLETLLSDCKGVGGDVHWNGDWYPARLIRYDAFEEEMDQMIEDIYGDEFTTKLPSFMSIKLDYMALRMDYTSVYFDEVEYLTR